MSSCNPCILFVKAWTGDLAAMLMATATKF
jgi:hypothetical protein